MHALRNTCSTACSRNLAAQELSQRKLLRNHHSSCRSHRRSSTQCSAEPAGCSTDRAVEQPVASVVSCGVPVSSYSLGEALTTVTGKSFACTSCGKCCSLADGAEVWLNSKELGAIAAHLGISTEQATSQYLHPYDRVPGWHLLKSKTVQGPWPSDLPQTHQDRRQHLQRQVCIFLDKSTNACSIYPVRPLQCSTYPWWPELMPPGNWKAEQQHVCEGIEHPDAPHLDRWHAAQQLQLATEHVLLLEAAKPAGWDPDKELYSASS